jgi:hypothetical protein
MKSKLKPTAKDIGQPSSAKGTNKSETTAMNKTTAKTQGSIGEKEQQEHRRVVPTQKQKVATRNVRKETTTSTNVLKEALTKSSNNGRKEEGNQFADTDSDDAGLLPSERSEYKGVSRSFRGLDATEPFDEEPTTADPNGRLAEISEAYDSIPVIEQTKLPRGGISMETKAIGRIQVRRIIYFVRSNLIVYPLSLFLFFDRSLIFPASSVSSFLFSNVSLGFHRKPLKIACDWVSLYLRCTSYPRNVSVEKWVQLWG